MKYLVALFTIVCTAFAGSMSDAVDAMNYPLGRVMAPHRTYAGVLADAQDVTVEFGPRGLVGGLTLGLANFTFGTNLGSKKVTVHQYVVRLDQPDNREAQILTVIQGGGQLIEPGTPVFLATQSSQDGYVFSVRVIPCRAPEAYAVRGLEESRLAALRTTRK